MKTNKIIVSLLFSTFLAVLFTSCDSKTDAVQVVSTFSNGVFVLNQGSFKGNNASLSFYDLSKSTVTADVFTTKNNRGLGDTGQDMVKYGSKIYIAVYTSSLIEVINASTGVSIKSIPMLSTSNAPSSPRSLATFNGKVYISLFDGHVAQLDTASLLVEKTIAVGSNPENIVIANNKIFVANSGGMAAKMDSTVSVIDPVSFTVTKNIKVVINPTILKADAYGDVYVISNGDYSLIPYTLQRIDAAGNVSTVANIHPINMTIEGDNAYLYSYDYDANYKVVNKAFIQYDVKNQKPLSSSFITSSTIVKTPYSIDVNPITKDIYIGETDFVNIGKMYCFGQDGTLKFSFATGVSPAKTVFITK